MELILKNRQQNIQKILKLIGQQNLFSYLNFFRKKKRLNPKINEINNVIK